MAAEGADHPDGKRHGARHQDGDGARAGREHAAASGTGTATADPPRVPDEAGAQQAAEDDADAPPMQTPYPTDASSQAPPDAAGAPPATPRHGLIWRSWDRACAAIHAVHGTRSLTVAIGLLLVLSLLEPLITARGRAWYTLLIFLVAVVGLTTLPREGVAVQERLQRLVKRHGVARPLVLQLASPLLLLVLLSPGVFLAAYGVPHMNPFTGLITPDIMQRVAAGFLFLVLLLPVVQLRLTRRFAREVVARRPRDFPAGAYQHKQRDLLQGLMLLVVALWLFFLAPFWRPFSLLDWPPDLSSFAAGVRGVAALCYTVFLPVILLILAASYAQALRTFVAEHDWRREWYDAGLLLLHIALLLTAVGLHAYNLLWIAQFEAAAAF